VAQRRRRPRQLWPIWAVSALLATLFAALAGRLMLGESMSHVQLAGGALIFACVMAVPLVPLMGARRREAATA